MRRVAFGEHRGDLLDQPALHHLLGAPRDPLVQHRPGHGQHNVPRVQSRLRARRLLPVGERVGRVSSATSMARAARCRPPPRKPGSSRAGPAEQLERLEPRGARVERPPPRGIERRLAERAPPPARGRRAPCRRPPPAAGRGRGSSASQRTASRAKWPALYRVPGIDQVEPVVRRPARAPSGSAWRCRCRAGGRPGASRPR